MVIMIKNSIYLSFLDQNFPNSELWPKEIEEFYLHWISWASG